MNENDTALLIITGPKGVHFDKEYVNRHSQSQYTQSCQVEHVEFPL